MSAFTLTTPVVLQVFNRPNETSRVFEAIREARPPQLLVVADGPRLNRTGESELCAEVRRIVARVEWPCQVLRNYADENLGCKLRVSSGLDWVFRNVEEAIIIEDDCVPDPTFFRFCQEMLDHYRDEERIMSICGSNLVGSWKADRQSYHLSRCFGVWGWATWRRAWNFYDVDMPLWRKPEVRLRIRDELGNSPLYRMRALDFDRLVSGRIDTWDYQWTFAQLERSGFCVVPSVNLVSNIGFHAEATHTVDPENSFAALPASACQFPLDMHNVITVDHDYDAAVVAKTLSGRPLLLKLSDFVRSFGAIGFS